MPLSDGEADPVRTVFIIKYNGYGVHFPNILAVLTDSPIRLKLAHTCAVRYRHARPMSLILKSLTHLFLAIQIGLTISKKHISLIPTFERMLG